MAAPYPTTRRIAHPVSLHVDEASVGRLLITEQRSLLNEFLAYVKQECEHSATEVTSLEVSGFEGAEGTKEIVITIQAATSTDKAMEFWNRLGTRIEEWLGHQSEKMRRAVREQFAVEVCGQSGCI